MDVKRTSNSIDFQQPAGSGSSTCGGSVVQLEINPGGVRAEDKDGAGSREVEKMKFWMLGKQTRLPAWTCV